MSWINNSQFLTNDNTVLHYLKNFDSSDLTKDEVVIVFNYGLVCNIEHFKYQYDFFDKQGYKVLLHDYRCHFQSNCEEIKSCTFENICDDLNLILDHLEVTNTVMIGHSMGVNVTLEFARMYPKRLNSMVLISGSVFPPQDVMFDSNVVDVGEPYIHQLRDRLGNVYEQIWKNVYKNPLAKIIVWRGGFNTKKTKLDFVEYYMKKIGELSPDLFFHLLTEMKQHNVIVDLEKLNTPSLIIGGDKDKIIPNYLQRILKKYLKSSKLYIVKDGSHVPQVDFPQSINERCLSFIKKNVG